VHYVYLLERYLLHDQNTGALDNRIKRVKDAPNAYFGFVQRMVRPAPNKMKATILSGTGGSTITLP
jgi:hypothetical protein